MAGVSKLPGNNHHEYILLHLEFVSNHTCTHIALWCSECDEIGYKAAIRTRIYSVVRKDYLPGHVRFDYA